MIRQFYLQNRANERVSFIDATHFLSTPTGLGFSNSATYIEQSKGFYTLASSKPNQQSISGTIVFTKQSAYNDYRTLTQWINANEFQLTLVYKPYGETEYYCDVLITSLGKGELKQYGWLECETTMVALTPWYSKSNLTLRFDGEEGEGKRYSYTYPLRYGASRKPTTIALKLDGDFDAYLLARITGALNNPYLILKNKNTNEIIGKLGFNDLSLGANEALIYDTRPSSCGVWVQRGTEITSVIDKVELIQGTQSFFAIPKNTPCELTLQLTEAVNSGSNVTVYQYWRTR